MWLFWQMSVNTHTKVDVYFRVVLLISLMTLFSIIRINKCLAFDYPSITSVEYAIHSNKSIVELFIDDIRINYLAKKMERIKCKKMVRKQFSSRFCVPILFSLFVSIQSRPKCILTITFHCLIDDSKLSHVLPYFCNNEQKECPNEKGCDGFKTIR